MDASQPNPFVDYYKVLELEHTASLRDVKVSYKRLSKVYHPDRPEGGKSICIRLY